MWGCCGQHRSTSGSAAALVLVQAARLPPGAAALVLVQAARLPPGPTRNAAEPTARPNAAATSADTDENGRVCVGGLGPYALLLGTTSEQQRAAAVHHSHVHRVHHVRGGADDVSGLLIAALTASTRANRPWQRRPGLQAPVIRWQPEELLLVSGCSGHADRSGPDVDAAASCSYLSDCMSLSGHRHLLRALCWLAWCSRQTSGARLDRTRRGRCGAAVGTIGAPLAAHRLGSQRSCCWLAVMQRPCRPESA